MEFGVKVVLMEADRGDEEISEFSLGAGSAKSMVGKRIETENP